MHCSATLTAFLWWVDWVVCCMEDLLVKALLCNTHCILVDWIHDSIHAPFVCFECVCIPHALVCMYACTCTHTHAHSHQRRSIAAAKWSGRPNETLGCLGTTEALRASAGKSTWGRASAPQVGLYYDGVGTQSPYPLTWTWTAV